MEKNMVKDMETGGIKGFKALNFRYFTGETYHYCIYIYTPILVA